MKNFSRLLKKISRENIQNLGREESDLCGREIELTNFEINKI